MRPTRNPSRPHRRRTAGRPRSFDRDKVLDGAVEVFWERGYRSTTTRDLEAALGLAPSSIYNTFGSKRELLNAALERYERQVTDRLVTPLETSTDGLAALTEFFTALGRWIVDHRPRGCLLINTTSEDVRVKTVGMERASQYRLRLRRALQRAIKRSVAAGDSYGDHDGSRADLLLGFVLGLNVASRAGASTAELERMVRAVRKQIDDWQLDKSTSRSFTHFRKSP